MNNISVRTEAARHYCRKTGCEFVIGPEAKAHQQVRQHRMATHGSMTMVVYCNAECGYRARPFEGRYTQKPYVVCESCNNQARPDSNRCQACADYSDQFAKELTTGTFWGRFND